MGRKKTHYKVLIVDDHPMMRQGLAQLVNHEPDLAACGEAGTAAQALNFIAARKPDLVLADISLPDKNGLELIKDIQVFHPGLPVLVFSMHDESLYAERVLRAGGRGYIMKQEGGKRLMQAIHQVLGGQIYVSERMAAKILEIFSGRRSTAIDSPVELLSDREFEVFQYLGWGNTTREIAERLHLSVKTVEVHRANIKKKLKLKGTNDMVRYAVRWLDADPPGRRQADSCCKSQMEVRTRLPERPG
jgi:DNA-binding NarL/FixJ family response regulator